MTDGKVIRKIELIEDENNLKLVEDGKAILSFKHKKSFTDSEWKDIRDNAAEILHRLEQTPKNGCAPGIIPAGQSSMTWSPNKTANFGVSCGALGPLINAGGLERKYYDALKVKKKDDVAAQQFIPKAESQNTDTANWCAPAVIKDTGNSAVIEAPGGRSFTVSCTADGTLLKYKPAADKLPAP